MSPALSQESSIPRPINELADASLAVQLEGAVITHFSIHSEPDPAGWIQLFFCCSKGPHHSMGYGFDFPCLPPERQEGLQCLPVPVAADLKKGLWLTETGAVVFADIEDPLGDPSKIECTSDYRSCPFAYNPDWAKERIEALSARPQDEPELVRFLVDKLHFFQGHGGPQSDNEEGEYKLFVQTLNDLAEKHGLPPIRAENYMLYREVGDALFAALAKATTKNAR